MNIFYLHYPQNNYLCGSAISFYDAQTQNILYEKIQENKKQVGENTNERNVEKILGCHGSGCHTGAEKLAAFIERDIAVIYFAGNKLEKMIIEDGNDNEAMLSRIREE